MIFPLKDINPTERFPVMTVALIAANALVFLYQLSLGNAVNGFIAAYGMIPYEVTRGVDLIGADPGAPIFHTQSPGIPFLTVLTSMFIHGGFFHIFGNMLYLWIFGNNIEDLIGPVRFLVFYLICGVAAGATHILVGPSSTIPTVGASGAVSGVLGAYLIAYPHARVLTAVFIIFIIRLVMMPAYVLLILWFVLQLFSGVGALGIGGGGVAWFAHVGGFVAGLLLIRIMAAQRLAWRHRDDR